MPNHDPQLAPMLFDATRTAQLLGISVKTVRRETTIGRLPCARIGLGSRAIRYNLQMLDEYIRRCTDDGRAA